MARGVKKREWIVEASSAEEAIEIVRNGGGIFANEELTADALDFSSASAEPNG